MIGNPPQDRDELLVTGVPPVVEPLLKPVGDTKTLTEEAAPVFVDASGWRARLGRRLGLLVGALLVVFLGALGLGMTTGTNVPLTPWSEPSPHPRVQVSHPKVTPAKTAGPPAAVRPAPTRQAGASAPPVVTSRTPKPATTAVTTTRPGKSQATPPAWGQQRGKRP